MTFANNNTDSNDKIIIFLNMRVLCLSILQYELELCNITYLIFVE